MLGETKTEEVVSVKDIRSYREELLRQQARAERDREQAEDWKSKISDFLDSLQEEDLALLESNGIYARELKNYDLSKILTSGETREEFSNLYNKIMRQISDMIKTNGGLSG